MSARKIILNGLSIGSGGGYTVAIELWRHIAMARPDWTIMLLVVAGNPLHEEVRAESTPANCQLLWAPSSAKSRWARAYYERTALVTLVRQRRISAVVQLNGMLVPGLPCPTLAHCQDPLPYQPDVSGFSHSYNALAFLKRRGNKLAFRRAAVIGFTSQYLRDLMCGRLGVIPTRSEVFYNGLPDSWIARAQEGVPDWNSRPMEIVTVSNVAPYKQHEMVIRALPAVLRNLRLKSLTYRIVGQGPKPYVDQLRRVAAEIGVGDNVILEGRVPRQRLEELLGRARCYVLMSKCESFGLPAIEAMAFGTPVITADCCAMPEVCGDAAVLSPTTDLHALSQNIIQVVSDQTLAEQLRQRGLRRLGNFSWKKSAEQFAAALDRSP